MDCLTIQTKIMAKIDTHQFGEYLEDSSLVLFITSTQQRMIQEETWIPTITFVTKMVDLCRFLPFPELSSIILDSHIADQARLQNVDFVAKSRDSTLRKKISFLMGNFKFEHDLSILNEYELMKALSEITTPVEF